MRHELGGHALGRDLVGGLAERERLGLREEFAIEQIVVLVDGVVGVGTKPMKSHGTSVVPWCSSWKYACWPFVPG